VREAEEEGGMMGGGMGEMELRNSWGWIHWKMGWKAGREHIEGLH
jgi:hypothetical protein